jgi:riboflavin kinase / FMN adenylyltransferase
VITSRDGGRAPAGAELTAGGCAVSVGNFDGVHRGHAAILRRLVAAARRCGVPAVAFTFDPHPAAILRPGGGPAPLSTASRRAELLLAQGVDAVLVQPTDRDLVALGAREFFDRILRERLRVRAIVEGEDFRFGAGRTGDVAFLAELCAAAGVELEAVPPVLAEGLPVSSSRVRAHVAAGDVRAAADLLTAPYRITGRVVEGARRGATLGFPTANLAAVATLVPAAGVYAARATVPDGRTFPAAVHLGPAPSFAETRPTIEPHLVGFSGDLYGATLHVDFLDRVRETRRFASIDDLKAQLAADVAAAVRIAGRPDTAAGPA